MRNGTLDVRCVPVQRQHLSDKDTTFSEHLDWDHRSTCASGVFVPGFGGNGKGIRRVVNSSRGIVTFQIQKTQF